MNVLQTILEKTNAVPMGAGWKGMCPTHADRNPSLSIDSRDGKILIKCFAGCETRDIVEVIGIKMSDLEVNEADLIHRVWDKVISLIGLDGHHVEALDARAGYNRDWFSDWPKYRTVGPNTGRSIKLELFSEFTVEELKQVPGIFDQNGMLLRLPDGILVPIRDRWGNISGVQIRRDDSTPKYWTPKGSKLDVHVPLDRASDIVKGKLARITEGALKADIATLLSSIPTIGLIGVSNWKALPDTLHRLAVSEVLLAFDADYQTNAGVRQSLVKLYDELRSHAFRVGIETWDASKAKGVDDALLQKVATNIRYDADDFISGLRTSDSNLRTSSNTNGPGRSIVEVVRASSVAPKRTTWLWKNWLPLGSVTIMDGDPSLGKSTLTLGLVGSVTTGTPMPDGDCCNEPANTIVMSAEDSIDRTTVPRLMAVGADLDRVDFFQYVIKGDNKLLPSIPHDLDKLEAMIQENKAKLIVIDPFFAYLDRGVNSFKDHEVRAVMDRLGRIADRQQASILLLRHLNKAGSTNALYRGGGSIGIIAAVRTGWLVAKDPYLPPLEPGGVLTMTKNNLGPYPNSLRYKIEQAEVGPGLQTSKVVWNGVSDLVARDLVTVTPSDQTEADKRMGWLADLVHSKKEIAANDLRMECDKAGYSYMKLLKLSPQLLASYGIVKGTDNVYRSTDKAEEQVY